MVGIHLGEKKLANNWAGPLQTNFQVLSIRRNGSCDSWVRDPAETRNLRSSRLLFGVAPWLPNSV